MKQPAAILPGNLPSRLRSRLLKRCRFKPGSLWQDPLRGHRLLCGDAADQAAVLRLMDRAKAHLAVQDPPYNLAALDRLPLPAYLAWTRRWVSATLAVLARDASFYLWMGADQERGFQPLPEVMLLLRQFKQLRSRSFLTLRNQRGYGTQRNWMSLRQELLYYVKGKPAFQPQYTAIPKILRGYYKRVGGKRTDNLERGRSPNIRPGNVWVDIQQVFYRLKENVPLAYAQKPLAALERILAASSKPGQAVLDCFSHSGTTLLAAERLGRRAYAMDKDPLYCEISLRRLEHYRATGQAGFQQASPFDPEKTPKN